MDSRYCLCRCGLYHIKRVRSWTRCNSLGKYLSAGATAEGRRFSAGHAHLPQRAHVSCTLIPDAAGKAVPRSSCNGTNNANKSHLGCHDMLQLETAGTYSAARECFTTALLLYHLQVVLDFSSRDHSAILLIIHQRPSPRGLIGVSWDPASKRVKRSAADGKMPGHNTPPRREEVVASCAAKRVRRCISSDVGFPTKQRSVS